MIVEAFGAWLDGASLWTISVAILVAMIVASLLGYVLRWRRDRSGKAREQPSDAQASQESYVVSAVLSLLALLTGFTYALAVDRFEIRRSLVLEEANAIDAAYLRTQLLDAPHRERISNLLVSYTNNRIALSETPAGRGRDLLATNDRLITELWTATVAAFPSMRGYDFSSSYLESMNSLINLDTARKVARLARVPSAVYFVLFIYLMVSAAVMGYVLSGLRGRASAVFLFLLFVMSILLVIDIDRPTDGRIRESQAPMLLLRASLAAQPPAVFDRLNGAP